MHITPLNMNETQVSVLGFAVSIQSFFEMINPMLSAVLLCFSIVLAFRKIIKKDNEPK